MDFLNKKVLAEISFEDYVKIHYGERNLVGISFLLTDNSVVDSTIEDGVEINHFKSVESFLDDYWFEEDNEEVFIWDDIVIPEFPEVIKVHEWEVHEWEW